MRVVVATHGHCFDGLASAVIFTRLLRNVLKRDASIEYRACGYGPTQKLPNERMLNGDENAILDYRYYASPGLTWYFDHHRTSFQEPGDRESFEASIKGGKFFHDAAYSSCARLIMDRGRDEFGFLDEGLEKLAWWADVVDTARFESPYEAIDRKQPVMRMVSVIENHGGSEFLEHYVPLLSEASLDEVAQSPAIAEKYEPIGAKHDAFFRRLETESKSMGRVVYSDLTRERVDVISKFAAYALYPRCTYSVLVARIGSTVKISVGYNPWSGQPLDTDISAICARHGGGGHPVVGGITLRASETEQARRIAEQIARELEERVAS